MSELMTKKEKFIIKLLTDIMSYQDEEKAEVEFIVKNTYQSVLINGFYYGSDLTEASVEVLEMFVQRKDNGEIFPEELENQLRTLTKIIS